MGERAISPHSLFYLIYTALYFIPLFLVGISGYGEGLVAETGSGASALMSRIAAVYLIGTGSFLLGSWSTSKIAWLLGERKPRPLNLAYIRVYKPDKFLLVFLICGFLLSKILLIPAGAYSNYAFDSSMMDNATWTTSMFFSETLAFAALIVLFSNVRHNVLMFGLLSALNGLNLLHGTRNFFVTAMTGGMLYLYVRKGVPMKRMLLYGLGGASTAIVLGYVVYLQRSHAGWTDFSILSVLSPITYESVFSQISLVNVVGHPEMIESLGHLDHFVVDIFVFALPRFIVGNKEALLWTNTLGDLSPLGAFNGFAIGLLYFGYLLPAAYFLLGLSAGILQRLARESYAAAIYAYFCCDFVYRIQRDGYAIPIKMGINNIEILCILGIVHLWRRRGAYQAWSRTVDGSPRHTQGGVLA